MSVENLIPRISVMKSAEDALRGDPSKVLNCSRQRRVFAQQTKSFDGIVIMCVFAQHAAQVYLADDQYVIQALATQCVDQVSASSTYPLFKTLISDVLPDPTIYYGFTS